jgi:hypothetical protein
LPGVLGTHSALRFGTTTKGEDLMFLKTTRPLGFALGFAVLSVAACGAQVEAPTGQATVTGPQSIGVTNAWAFHPPAVSNYGFDLSTNPNVLQILISDGPQMACPRESGVTDNGAFAALVFAVFPKQGETAVGPGTYPIAESQNGEGLSALSLRFSCGAGPDASCLESGPLSSGTLTITGTGDSVTGSFSVTFDGDAAPTKGTFSVPLCD